MAIKPLTGQQKVALQLLLDGHRKCEIQEKLGISQPTLSRWLKLPAWHQALEEAVREEQSAGEVHMRTLMPLATKTVHKLLLTGADNVKLGASRLVFETVAHMLQREEQQAMLTELESRLEELQDAARNQGLLPHAHEVADAVVVEPAEAGE
jgi:DNA-binding transcriptional ArsR family regulator